MKYPKIINGQRAGCTCYREHLCDYHGHRPKEVLDVCGNIWESFIYSEYFIYWSEGVARYWLDYEEGMRPIYSWRWRMKEDKND